MCVLTTFPLLIIVLDNIGSSMYMVHIAHPCYLLLDTCCQNIVQCGMKFMFKWEFYMCLLARFLHNSSSQIKRTVCVLRLAETGAYVTFAV